MTFPFPSGPVAWVIFALTFCGLAFIAYALICSYSQCKYLPRRHVQKEVAHEQRRP